MTAVDVPPTAPTTSDIVVVEHVRKSFGNVHALKDASMRLPRGEVTALIGDNGAGKSTLVRCLSGVHMPDAGTIEVDGRPAHIANPQQARDYGIETVHQNLALVEDLTVWQNLFLTRERTRHVGPLQFLDRATMRREAQDMVGTLAINVPSITSRVRRLSGGQRQAVSIARAVGWGSSVVIMDEPTAALGVQETARVENLIRDLRDRGLSILLISHNFELVLRLSDGVWIMRAGTTVASRRTAETNGDELVGLVTGAIPG